MHKSVLITVCAVFLAGCMSLSSYQTAQVLKEDEGRFGVGFTLTNVEPELGMETDYESVTYFMPEFIYRHGVA